jgi:hypothetical protein
MHSNKTLLTKVHSSSDLASRLQFSNLCQRGLRGCRRQNWVMGKDTWEKHPDSPSSFDNCLLRFMEISKHCHLTTAAQPGA